MGSLISKTPKPEEHHISAISVDELFNIQQNTFSNILLLDLRSKKNYNDSHIDLSIHCHFASEIDPKSNIIPFHREWLWQHIRNHQSIHSKSQITFYLIHNNDDDDDILSVSHWLHRLSHHKSDDIRIPQINGSHFYHCSFSLYHRSFPFLCTDSVHYEEGRLFPSKITESLYLSNWGIASDGALYRIMKDIQSVINCTPDHPNIFAVDEIDIFDPDFLNEAVKGGPNLLLDRQRQKVNALRLEFQDIRMEYVRVPIVDNSENDAFTHFERCCQWIETQIECKENDDGGNAVLIHCRHGQSRSVTVIASFLIYHNGMTVDEALQFIKERRPRSNPNQGFVEQLHKWHEYCHRGELVM